MNSNKTTSRTPRLMVVDDNRLQRALLRGMLKAEGFQVVEVSSGMLALARLQYDYSFDLILLDFIMPKISGLEVLASIKQNPITADIPVLMITGLTGKAEQKQAMACGAVGYVNKSASMNTVIARIKKQLAISGLSSPAPGSA